MVVEIIAYVSGIVPAYVAIKKVITQSDHTWTLGDRLISIGLSLSSWVCFGIACIGIIAEKKSDVLKKPAKW